MADTQPLVNKSFVGPLHKTTVLRKEAPIMVELNRLAGSREGVFVVRETDLLKTRCDEIIPAVDEEKHCTRVSLPFHTSCQLSR